MLIGLIAGAMVVGSVLTIDRLRLDDPVGAISVHLVCGIWGTLAVGIFSADHSLVTQLIGVLAYGAFSFPAALAIFLLLKLTLGLRVSKDEEAMGLDVGEHGMEAYGGFQMGGGTGFGSAMQSQAVASPQATAKATLGIS
jgi:Amt family ammonium transporter